MSARSTPRPVMRLGGAWLRVRLLAALMLGLAIVAGPSDDESVRPLPAVPLVGVGVPDGVAYPGWMIAAAAALLVRPASGPRRRWPAVAVLVAVAAVAAHDQTRLQPWVWQFAVIGVAMLLPTPATLRWTMRLAVSVYLFSAVSKLDAAFVDGLGQVLARGMAGLFGIDPEPRTLRLLAIAMPVFEAAVGLLLWSVRTRSPGLAAATAMHGGLLLTLGPWGLDHYAGVLWWNAFFLLHVWVLFFRSRQPLASRDQRRRAGPISWLLIGLVLLPILEPVGRWDHWPGWSVYSARPSRVTLEVVPPGYDLLDGVPLRPPAPLSDFQSVDLEGWAFARRRSPAYPQERTKLAWAAAVVDALPPGTRWRITILRADPWRRSRAFGQTVTIDRDEQLQRQLDAYWLPATATKLAPPPTGDGKGDGPTDR